MCLWLCLSTFNGEAGRAPEPERTDPEMSHPKQGAPRPNRHLEHALDRAHRLSEPRSQDQYTPAWWAEATQVGDLTALAALNLAQSLRASPSARPRGDPDG